MQGFQKTTILVKTFNGLDFILQEDLDYIAKDGTYYRIPSGTYSNGASTPQSLWNLIPPFGKYFWAAVAHDAAYDKMLLKKVNEEFVNANLTKQQSDSLLLEAMESLGVEEAEAKAIYEAVALFGSAAYNEVQKMVNGNPPKELLE